jgi:parallel beta-helix repeat protein
VNAHPRLTDALRAAYRSAAALILGRGRRVPARQDPGYVRQDNPAFARCSLIVALLIAVSSCGSSPTSPSGGAAQSVYYVAPTGRDQDSGTITAPFQTVSAGVKRLRPGDTLYLRAGIYTGAGNAIDSQSGTVPSGSSWSNPITIAGYAGEAVTLRPSFNTSGIRLTSGQSYLIFQDLSIDMVNSGPGADADGIYIYTAHHNRFQRIEVMHGQGFGVHFGNNTPFNELIDSRIHDVGLPNGSVSDGHGLYITASDNLFQNNDVYDNQGYGFHVYNNAGTHADPSRNILRGNRIHGNGRHGGTAYGVVIAWGDANEVADNQIYDNPGGIQVYTGSSNTTVRGNNVFNNRPLEGIIVQYATDTQVRGNTVNANGDDIVDLGTATAFSQNAVTAGRISPTAR